MIGIYVFAGIAILFAFLNVFSYRKGLRDGQVKAQGREIAPIHTPKTRSTNDTNETSPFDVLANYNDIPEGGLK